MYCTKCGAKLEENSKFCTSCGNSVDGSNASDNADNSNIVNNATINKVSIGSCIGTAIIVGILFFILCFILRIALIILTGNSIDIAFIQISLPILIILFGPFIIYAIKSIKNK